jgi:hypothetical protein
MTILISLDVKREVYDEHGDQVLKEGLIKNG